MQNPRPKSLPRAPDKRQGSRKHARSRKTSADIGTRNAEAAARYLISLCRHLGGAISDSEAKAAVDAFVATLGHELDDPPQNTEHSFQGLTLQSHPDQGETHALALTLRLHTESTSPALGHARPAAISIGLYYSVQRLGPP